MTNEIKIGIGNKDFTRFSLIVEGIIFLVMLVLPLFNKDAWGLSIMFCIGIAIDSRRQLKRKFLTFNGSHFIVRGPFKELARIKADQFDRVINASIWSALPVLNIPPFSNQLVVRFKDGLSFEINGGLKNHDALEQYILELIRNKPL